MESRVRSGIALCPAWLRKLQSSVGFDVVGRCRKLSDFYAKAGISDEVTWLERRLEAIGSVERIEERRTPRESS